MPKQPTHAETQTDTQPSAPSPLRKRTWFRALAFLSVLYVAWCTTLFFYQGKMLFPADLAADPMPMRYSDATVELTRDIPGGGKVIEDGCIRPETTPDTLAGLKPAFSTSGSVTAGTASPLTDKTRGIISAGAIEGMKDGVRLVNCARGGLIVEKDLKRGLENGHIAGVGLDVFSHEPATENDLFGMENVIATPHLGASTTEAQEKVALQVAEQLADYLTNGAVTNALNMPSLTAEEAPRLTPYMKLAKQLGSFIGQIAESGLKSVTIEYEGHCTELNTRPLTAVVLQGLLSPLMESVNMVNAPVIARERDIEVSEIRHERDSAYQTLIRLTVQTEKQTRSIAGTLFAGALPRIVEIKDIPIDAELGPNMLFITNKDKPGFIGNLGSTLGDAGINIATFHLGRAEPGGDAIALIEIDQEPGEEVMQAVCELPQVVQVKALTF